MEKPRLAIDISATEKTFAKYGGAFAWYNTCMAEGFTDDEEEVFGDLSFLCLIDSITEQPIRHIDHDESYDLIRLGLNFGMFVLALNSKAQQPLIAEEIYDHTLEYFSDTCQELLRQNLSGEETELELVKELEETSEPSSRARILPEYTELIDRHVIALEPDPYKQRFLKIGAEAAEMFFGVAAKISREYIEQDTMHKFAEIEVNLLSEIGFEI